jgi:hypothetical protein
LFEAYNWGNKRRVKEDLLKIQSSAINKKSSTFKRLKMFSRCQDNFGDLKHHKIMRVVMMITMLTTRRLRLQQRRRQQQQQQQQQRKA